MVNKALVSLVVSILIVLLVASTIPVSYKADAQVSPYLVNIKPSLTNIYDLMQYKLPQNLIPRISMASYLPGSSMLLVAGPGAYGIGYLDTATRNIILESAGALIGNPTMIFYDNVTNPSWYGFASDSGELLLVNSTDLSYIKAYYTATRTPAIGAVLSTVNGSSKLVAVDREGYAYFYSIPSDFWLEIGPGSHDTALASLPYYQFDSLAPIVNMNSKGESSSDRKVVLGVVNDAYLGNITVSLYYNNSGTYDPVLTGSTTNNSVTTVKVLYLYLATPNGLVFSALKNITSTINTYYINRIQAGNWSLITLYYIRNYNATTGALINETCYYLKIPVTVTPFNTTVLTLNLTNQTATPTNALALTETVYLGNQASMAEYLVVDTHTLNTKTIKTPPHQGGTLQVTFLPIPSYAAGEPTSFIKIYKPENPPATWPKNATTLMLIGKGRYLLIYVLDNNLTALPISNTSLKYVEVADLGATVTAAAIDPSGATIYAGSGAGRIVMLTWNATYGKYLASNSYMLDTNPVTSLSVSPTGDLLVAGSASGILQLLDTKNWEPLWRGPPGYTGIQTGLANLEVSSSLPNLMLLYSPGSQSISIFYQPVVTLVPAIVNMNITEALLTGQTINVEVPPGSNATVYNATTGQPAAYTVLEGGNGILYLPPGSYTFEANLTGLGSLKSTRLVTYPQSLINITVNLREVMIYAYTPEKSNDPAKTPGYYLVSGPKPGTSVTIKPYTYDTSLGYTPSPLPQTGTTGGNGTLITVVWDGVSYTVSGQLPGYYSSNLVLPLYGVGNFSLIMNPILSKVSFSLVDSDSLQAGQPYYIGEASIQLTYQVNKRSVNIQLTAANQTFYLPPGDYQANINAPHYEPVSTQFNVALPQTSVEAVLTPMSYALQLTVYGKDTSGLGIGSGPLGGATVNISMVWPIPGYVQATLYTDPSGGVSTVLRYGLYKVKVSDPYAKSTSFYLLLGNDKSMIVSLTLKNSDIYLIFRDSEFTSFPVNNATITLTYLGSSWSNNVTLKVNGSLLHVVVPYGIYSISASAQFYSVTTQQLNVQENVITKYIFIKPAYVTLTIQVLYNTTQGLAQGPVQNAKISMGLLKPDLPIGIITAVTGADGKAIVTVREGVYSIEVSNPYTSSASAKIIVNNSIITTITVTPLKANASIKIVDSITGTPIPGATLNIQRIAPGSPVTATYTVNGSINLTLPAGLYQITAYLEGRYQPYAMQVTLPPGSNTTLHYRLTPETGNLIITTYSQLATIAVGEKTYTIPPIPLENSTIQLIPFDNLLQTVYNRSLTYTTGIDGKAYITGIRTGTYKIIVTYNNFEKYITTVTITSGETMPINISLKPLYYKIAVEARDNALKNPILENYTLKIISYNKKSVDITIPLTGKTTLELPGGSYQAITMAEYYNPSIIKFNVPDNASIQINMTPVTYTYSLNLAVNEKPYKGPVTNMTIIARSLSWNLINPYINSTVINGQTTLQLRPGKYMLYLVNPYYNVNMSLGEITVKDNTTTSIEIKVPLYKVTLSLFDQDLKKPIYTSATLTITYNGPLGTATLNIKNAKPETTLSLAPGTYIVVASSPAYVTKTQNLIIRESTSATIILTPYRVNAALSLVDIDGKPVLISNATVIFKHVETGEILPGKIIEGKIIPYKGLRLGTYSLSIVPPPSSYINTTTVTINVTKNGVTPVTIVASPRFYQLTIILFDPVAGKPTTQPFTVTITRSGGGAQQYGLPLTTTVKGGVLNVTLPYGVYTITVKGTSKSYFLDPKPVVLSLYSSKTLRINLVPKQYKAIIYVVDDRGKPLPGAFVTISKNGKVIVSGPTDQDGSYTFTGTYGTYSVSVYASGYKTGYTTLMLPSMKSIQVQLQPGPKVIIKRYLPLMIGVVGLAAFAGFFYLARDRIMSKLSEEEEYF